MIQLTAAILLSVRPRGRGDGPAGERGIELELIGRPSRSGLPARPSGSCSERQEQHPQSGRSEPGVYTSNVMSPNRGGEEQDDRPALERRPGDQLAKVEPGGAPVRIAIEGLEQTGRSGNGIGRGLGVLDDGAEPLTELREMGFDLRARRTARSSGRRDRKTIQAPTAGHRREAESADRRRQHPHPVREDKSRTQRRPPPARMRASPSQNWNRATPAASRLELGSARRKLDAGSQSRPAPLRSLVIGTTPPGNRGWYQPQSARLLRISPVGDKHFHDQHDQ